MKKLLIAPLIVLLMAGCSHSNNNIAPPAGNSDITANTIEEKSDSFFPVTSFIRGQLIMLDSFPVTPLQVTVINKKSDSVWLSKKALKAMLSPFLTPVIAETNLVEYFKETKFNDQTLNAITFTYDPLKKIPDSISLRHWDVYVNPETGSVAKVYIVKNIKKNGDLFTQQLTWQTDKLAKISTILNNPDGSMILLKEVFFIWDFRPVQ